MAPSKATSEFNMEFKEVTFTSVAVGVIHGSSASVAAEVRVPFLTNSVVISKHAELLLQVDEGTKPAKKSKTWKDDVAVTNKKVAAKQGANGKAKVADKSSMGMIDI